MKNDKLKNIITDAVIAGALIYILLSLFGCTIIPHPDYKTSYKGELTIKDTIKDRIMAKQNNSFRGSEPLKSLGSFGGYFSGYYNGRQFMHEHYAQFFYSVPAMTQYQWQLNRKTESWMSQYGAWK